MVEISKFVQSLFDGNYILDQVKNMLTTLDMFFDGSSPRTLGHIEYVSSISTTIAPKLDSIRRNIWVSRRC